MKRILLTLSSALSALAVALAGAVVPARAAATVINPGFEQDGARVATPSGWHTYGVPDADYTETGGRSGSWRLTHWANYAYYVETWQTLDGLANGTYTLRVWVRSGGGQHSVTVGLRDCGGPERTVGVPATDSWRQLSVQTTVTGGRCTISLRSNAQAGNWASFDDVTFTADSSGGGDNGGGSGGGTLRYRGADVSSLPKSEAFGGRWYDFAGNARDPLAILRDNGVNVIRLKVWVNPADGYNTKARILPLARRIKSLGMDLLIDFHYSDTWADPGKQYKPAAWRSYSFDRLRQAVYDHTYDVLSALQAQGTPADLVQVGNEIDDGMLWEDGRASTNWGNLAALLNAGVAAVKAVSAQTQVILHLAEGGDNSLFRWWFDNAIARGVRFDVIGVSYYPYWHGPLSGLQANLNDIAARYGKPVLVVETGYPFTTGNDDHQGNMVTSPQPYSGYPATPEGQAAMVRAVMNVVKAVPNGRGLGVLYWEPTWTAVPGSGWDPADPRSGNGWENQALFDFDDRALPALREFAG